MNNIVIDCSVLAAWFLSDENNEYSNTLLQRFLNNELQLYAPSLLQAEIRNVLLVSYRRKRIILEYTYKILDILENIHILYNDTVDYKYVFELAKQHNLSLYDALYLNHAIQRDFQIATLDKQLKIAADKLQILFVI